MTAAAAAAAAGGSGRLECDEDIASLSGLGQPQAERHPTVRVLRIAGLGSPGPVSQRVGLSRPASSGRLIAPARTSLPGGFRRPDHGAHAIRNRQAAL